MSKSLRNYPDVNEVSIVTVLTPCVGSYCLHRFCVAVILIVTQEGIRETVRQVLLPLWNTWYFFASYAGTCNDGQGYLAQSIDLTSESEISVFSDG